MKVVPNEPNIIKRALSRKDLTHNEKSFLNTIQNYQHLTTNQYNYLYQIFNKPQVKPVYGK